MENYIVLETKKLVREEEQKAVLEDIAEDLKAIDISRLVGLGVTKVQFLEWLKERSQI